MKEQIEKQAIGEMSMDLMKAEHWYLDTDTCDFELDRVKTVKNLYDAGYRKQSVGEWVKVMNHKECSKCGYNAPYKKIKAGYHLQDLTKYCPNCGAHMKGGEEE